MEVLPKVPTVEQVDEAILSRYLELVESANPEDLARLLDSWAKYISARKNSDVFEKNESEAERVDRETREVVQGIVSG